jgi:membrane protein implicated in regulation of membrane protease activity
MTGIDLFAVAHPALAWLIGGLILMVVEALAPGVFLVWVGIAGVGTGLVALAFETLNGGAILDFPAQVIVFTVFAAVAIAAGLRLRKRRTPRTVNTPGSGLVGRTALALTTQGREGRVRIGDSDWEARLATGDAWPDPPRPLEVVGVDGCVVLVRPREK